MASMNPLSSTDRNWRIRSLATGSARTRMDMIMLLSSKYLSYILLDPDPSRQPAEFPETAELRGETGAMAPVPTQHSVQGDGDGVEGEAGEAADHGAVDADVLQVGTEQQLETPGGLLRIPSVDGSADERCDL